MHKPQPHTVLMTTLSVVLILCGLFLGVGGIWLAAVGGSFFYILVGILLLASGVSLLMGSAAALWFYAAALLAALAFGVHEVGLDWWQLAPRGDVFVILGLLLVVPSVLRSLDRSPSFLRTGGAVLMAGALLLSLGVGVAALANSPHEFTGTLPQRTAAGENELSVPVGEWRAYGRTAFGQRYSPLAQITPDNVAKLAQVWNFHTGDVRSDRDPGETTYEVTPLKVGDTLYFCTPHDLVFALAAETGKEKWRFDPKIREPSANAAQHLTCRGLSYSEAPAGDMQGSPNCRQRLFLPTVDARLIAISALDGTICPGFGGQSGTVDLWQNMPNVQNGSYYSTSPPVVTRDLIIVGGAVNDNVSTTEPSGVIRAYNIDTGALVWNWDSRNPEQTAPIAQGQTYSENSPNSWSVSSYDPTLGMIFVPMGNQPPDQYGAGRDANVEKYSSSVVALDAETGKVAWVFQGVHHDLWDMDVPAQPSLVDLDIKGAKVPAIVAPTKQGEIFVLNRKTGEPLLPVTEEQVPQGAVEGDRTSPTQPRSALSFKPEPLTESAMWGITPFDQLACRLKFRTLRYEGRFTPPSTQGSIVYPGNFGTFNWGGVAVDPERQIVFAMPVYIAFTSKLVARTDKEGRFVTKEGSAPFNENFGAPYAAKMGPFLSPLGIPCQAPPWGYVAAADLTTGAIAYRHVNGTVRDLSSLPLPLKLGVPGLGGPLITKGGVAFLSGTLDYYVRAYQVNSGALLWEKRLPAGGQATPMTYWSDASQRQFVVVVAGGHGSSGTKAGDEIIAYALPKQG